MMENIIVVIVVGISLIYIIRRIRMAFSRKSGDSCACGCTGCDVSSACGENVDALQACEPKQKK
mgnify:CR=1 FL=1